MYDEYFRGYFESPRPPVNPPMNPPMNPGMNQPMNPGMNPGMAQPMRKVGDIFEYRVRPGDNVYSLARRFNSSVDYIICMNNLKKDAKIMIDQILLIPVLFRPKQPIRTEEITDYQLYF